MKLSQNGELESQLFSQLTTKFLLARQQLGWKPQAALSSLLERFSIGWI
ncbi:hypothetical protein IQ238_22085 [Pleurocapsales cyanobacterium LEGE 06147]|nr:hypothetical protein [Pleurocapsales cyanobacterium LEGE 06147]